MFCEASVPPLKQWCEKFTAHSFSFGEQCLFCFIKVSLSGKYWNLCKMFIYYKLPVGDVLGILFFKVWYTLELMNLYWEEHYVLYIEKNKDVVERVCKKEKNCRIGL